MTRAIVNANPLYPLFSKSYTLFASFCLLLASTQLAEDAFFDYFHPLFLPRPYLQHLPLPCSACAPITKDNSESSCCNSAEQKCPTFYVVFIERRTVTNRGTIITSGRALEVWIRLPYQLRPVRQRDTTLLDDGICSIASLLPIGVFVMTFGSLFFLHMDHCALGLLSEGLGLSLVSWCTCGS